MVGGEIATTAAAPAAVGAAAPIVAGISSGQRSVVIDGESVNAFDPFEEVVGYAKTLEAYLDGKEKETSA